MTKQAKTGADEKNETQDTGGETGTSTGSAQQSEQSGSEDAGPASENPPPTLADVDAAVKSYLNDNLDELVKAVVVAGPLVEDVKAHMEAIVHEQLPGLVLSQVDQRYDADAAERARLQALKDEFAKPHVPTVEESATVARKNADKAAAATAKATQKAADALEAARQQERTRFETLFGALTATPCPKVADLDPDTRYSVMLDDGNRFAVGYARHVGVSDLSQVDDRTIRLAPALALSADMEAFMVRGVSLHFADLGAVRCELATPLGAGGGNSALLPADSLVFRAPAPAPVAAE